MGSRAGQRNLERWYEKSIPGPVTDDQHADMVVSFSTLKFLSPLQLYLPGTCIAQGFEAR